MDFPVCPSCHQSVIDDDAVDCPFCGASLKGKPGAKPTPPAAKAPASKAAAPSPPSARPGARPAPAKPTLPGDDFPFEAELTAGKPAIPSMPNPTKTRSLKVVCPMCDTAGYVPQNSEGQDVRCANPKCVMPVFTVPKPKTVAAAPPPPPPKKSNLPMVLGLVVVLGLVGLGGLYFVLSQGGGNTVKGPDEDALAEMQQMGKSKPKAPVVANNPKAIGNNPAAPKEAVAVQVQNDKLIESALKMLKDVCLENTKQRSKPYCRQLAAEANAVTGNDAAAREHLDQLVKVGKGVTYYRIPPFLELYWQNPKDTKSLALATSEVPSIPKFGRTRLELVGALATALVAAGQMDDVAKLASNLQVSDDDAQLAARLQFATDGKVGQLTDWYAVLPWKFPQPVAVTAALISHGNMPAAEKWAASQSDDDAKAECVAIWAEEVAYRKAAEGTADVDGAIAKKVESLPPALASRVWARAGCGRWRAKDKAGVTAAVNLATEKLSAIKVPAAPTMPVFKLTEKFKLPAAATLIQAATAAGEIAFLQAQTPETKADAEKSLDLALSLIDATAPSWGAAAERQAEVNRLKATGLRDRLRAEINKKASDDEAHRLANNFNRVQGEILAASRQRFDLETQLLSRLRAAGLNRKVWIVVNSRTSADDINQRDDFFATGLPGELIEGLKGTDEEKAILGAWSLRSQGDAPPRPESVVFNEGLVTSQVPTSIAVWMALPAKSPLKDTLPLEAATRLPAEGKLNEVFAMIAGLNDVVLREDCYRLAAAVAAQRGQADAVWKQANTPGLGPTEKAALCRGLIAGLKAAGQPTEPVPGVMANR